MGTEKLKGGPTSEGGIKLQACRAGTYMPNRLLQHQKEDEELGERASYSAHIPPNRKDSSGLTCEQLPV